MVYYQLLCDMANHAKTRNGDHLTVELLEERS